MATQYENIESAIVARLIATIAPGAAPMLKSATVLADGGQMSQAARMEAVRKLYTLAPASLVYLDDTSFVGSSVFDEWARFAVIVVATGISHAAGLRGDNGVYELQDHVIGRLHNYRDSAGLIGNPLMVESSSWLSDPDAPLTVAARIVTFKTMITRTVAN